MRQERLNHRDICNYGLMYKYYLDLCQKYQRYVSPEKGQCYF